MLKRVVGMTVGVTAFALMVAMVAPVTVGTQGARKPDQSTKGERSRVGAKDPNVKNDAATNTEGTASGIAKPASKGGETPRGGAYCSVMFDNYTDLWIRTYVDGRFTNESAPLSMLAM